LRIGGAVCTGNCTSSFCSCVVVSLEFDLARLHKFILLFFQPGQCFGVFNLWQNGFNNLVESLEVILHITHRSCVLTQQFLFFLSHIN